MTVAPNNEPTLQELSNKLDKISADLHRVSADNEKFNDKLNNYQQATQWVVQLAFTLMASAAVTVIVTAVLRK